MTTLGLDTHSELRFTLPSRYYWAPEVYELEKERIFYATWLCAGRVDQLAKPGNYVVRTVGDENVIIVRDKNYGVRAFYNVCRHRGSRLCTEQEGRFKGGAIVCPYHGWIYALDGRLLFSPNMEEREGFRRDQVSLYSIGVELWQGFIFINLNQQREPLAINLGFLESKVPRYSLPQLKVGHRIAYDVEANWKLVVENFTECNHCPALHPELCQIVPTFRQGIIRQGEEDGAALIEGAITLTTTGKTNRPLISTITDADHGRYRSAVIYPNLFLSLHPDCVVAHTLWPISPKATRVVTEWLFDPTATASPDFDPSDIVIFWDTVNRQDWKACELTQQGVQCRAHTNGMYAPQEHLPYNFNRYVLEKLQA